MKPSDWLKERRTMNTADDEDAGAAGVEELSGAL